MFTPRLNVKLGSVTVVADDCKALNVAIAVNNMHMNILVFMMAPNMEMVGIGMQVRPRSSPLAYITDLM